jgi:hypothetical protein
MKRWQRSGDTDRMNPNGSSSLALHPAWVAFIRHCRELGFGEISQLKIQNGLPVMAEETKKKVKFI